MKHDTMIEKVSERLARLHSIDDIIEQEIEFELLDTSLLHHYRHSNSVLVSGHGEIDLDIYIVYNNTALAFEMKHSLLHRDKAMYQLHKDVLYLKEKYGVKWVHKFFVYSDNSRQQGYNIEWIR